VSYVVVTFVVLVSMEAILGPMIDRYQFKEVVSPAAIEGVIKPDVELLTDAMSNMPLQKKIISRIGEKILELKTPYDYEFVNEYSDSYVSVGIYDATGNSLSKIEVPAFELPKQWPEQPKVLERRSDEECFLAIPIGKKGTGTIIVRHYAKFNFEKYIEANQIGEYNEMFWLPVVFSLPGIVLGLLFTLWIARRLKHISNATDAWSNGDFSQPIIDQRGDEISAHADLLNRTAENLKAHMVLKQQLNTAEERNRLARELHDSVKQQSFAVGLQLHAAEQWLLRDPKKAAQLVKQASSLNQNVQLELVSILQRLKTAAESTPNLQQSLQDLAAYWSTQIQVVFEIDDSIVLSDKISHEITRTVSEAFANVVKHAQAKHCKVVLERAEHRHVLLIIDDGSGFDSKQSAQGIGLQSMNERANALPEGRFEIQSDASGTTLKISWLSSNEAKK
jgi:two-component system, NarL family, sensor histidine kinase LiaS